MVFIVQGKPRQPEGIVKVTKATREDALQAANDFLNQGMQVYDRTATRRGISRPFQLSCILRAYLPPLERQQWPTSCRFVPPGGGSSRSPLAMILSTPSGSAHVECGASRGESITGTAFKTHNDQLSAARPSVAR